MDIQSALQPLLQQPVLCDEPMRRHTTWKIGGPADLFLTPANEDELANVLAFLHEQALPWMVVGNGSNLLVGDRGIRGVVIKLGEAFSRASWCGQEVEAAAGMLLSALALEAAERSLTGIEFARGIPGSVGGGIRMNAGAYGGTLSDYAYKVKAVDFCGCKIELNRDDIHFAYRNSSLFDLDVVITSVCFRLVLGNRDEIMATMKDFARRRSLAQPLEYPSCGSVFRNPPGDHAGHLIEMAGLRGLSCGDMEVSKKHGNFIVNHGAGTAAQARELIELVQQEVYNFSGVQLEPEVRFVGEF